MSIALSWLIFLAPPNLILAGNTDQVPRVVFGYATRCEDLPAQGRGSLVIAAVTPGSPAERAGLLNGDRIIAFNSAPFRFRTDAESIRSMAWIVPGEPLYLTILRDGEEKKITLVPEAASRDQISRLAAWLEQSEAAGSRKCNGELDAEAAANQRAFQILQKVEAAGGQALIRIERQTDEPPEFHVTSEQLDLPEDFDWRLQWPHFEAAGLRLKTGQSFWVRIKVDGSEVRIEQVLEAK